MSTPRSRCSPLLVPTLAFSLLLIEPIVLRADPSTNAAPVPPASSSTNGMIATMPPSSAPSTPATPTVGTTVTTASGLKYIDLAIGTGPVPATGSTVIVKYVGKLLDGTVFDASSMHGGEGTFTYIQGVTALISGWTEGVYTMHEGGQRKLIIPPELAYGMDGLPAVIPPNATLIFEIELVKVNVSATPTTPVKKGT